MGVLRYQLGDFTPHGYKTEDYGRSWRSLGDGIPRSVFSYAHVVREDPRNADVLYLGTELGIWTSLDRGDSWSSLRLNLPPVAVRDIKVHERENDVVVIAYGGTDGQPNLGRGGLRGS